MNGPSLRPTKRYRIQKSPQRNNRGTTNAISCELPTKQLNQYTNFHQGSLIHHPRPNIVDTWKRGSFFSTDLIRRAATTHHVALILPTKPKPLPKYVQGARYIVDQKLRLRLSVSFQTFVYKCQRCTSFTPTTNANNSRQARYVVISVRLAFFQSQPVCRPLRHTNSLRATSRQYTMVGPELRLLNIYPELASRTPPSPSIAPEHLRSLLSVTATFASPQLGLFDLQRSLREPLPPPPAAPSPAYTHPACATSWQLEDHWPPAWPPRSPALVLAALPPPSAAPPGAHRHPTRPV